MPLRKEENDEDEEEKKKKVNTEEDDIVDDEDVEKKQPGSSSEVPQSEEKKYALTKITDFACEQFLSQGEYGASAGKKILCGAVLLFNCNTKSGRCDSAVQKTSVPWHCVPHCNSRHSCCELPSQE